MKILINALSARQGGGQTYLLNLLKRSPRAEVGEVFILAPRSLLIPEDRPNVRRVEVGWPVENPFSRAIWEKIFLPGLIRKLGADVLFCPGGVIGAVAPDGCKTVTMFRNMIPFDLAQRRRYPLGYMRLRNWILQRLMLRSMLEADLVIFISEFARQVIEKYAPRPLKSSIVIPHGINPDFRVAGKVDMPRPVWVPEGPYLLYVSTLDYYKAQIEVVQGFALFRQRSGSGHKLVLVGPENPDYGRRLRAEIRRLQLESHVLVVGSVPYTELPGAYRHAVVNVFASESENCPNILLEALAAGRPVLSSCRPPMPEFGGDAVVYFDPASPREFAQKLALIVGDAALREKLALQALQRSAIYDWDRAADQTWKAIYGLMQKRAKC